MKYSVVDITNLMVHEFGQVECEFSLLSESDLRDVTPSDMHIDDFKEKLKSGELALLTDSPRLPVMMKESGSVGSNGWEINPKADNKIDASGQRAYLSRINMIGSSSSYSQSTSLHPPLPMPPYKPEPIVEPKQDKAQPLKYEYCFEIACSEQSFKENIGSYFLIEQTKKEDSLERWDKKLTTQGTRYRTLTAFNEPKRLLASVSTFNMGMSTKKNLQVRGIGSWTANEAFIPIHPAVQIEERLGFPTTGFYYHFHDKQLVQEYRMVDGETTSGFYATASYEKTLNPVRGANKDQAAILVFWKLDGKVVENQYIVYLERQMTQGELDNMDEAWLAEHGVKLDINALLATTSTTPAQRDAPTTTKDNLPSEPTTHVVKTDPSTGSRETWPQIAEQYGLSPKELLDLNAGYDSDPMSLAAGDTLNIKKEVFIAKAPVHALSPFTPERYSHALNAYYEYSDTLIKGTNIRSINNPKMGEADIAIVNLKKLATLRIGVFFDGTGQNNPNDAYKEQYGNKSRTNVARLFEAYPYQEGESHKIYISGVGTVDDIPLAQGERNAIIDAGDDEQDIAQAFGVGDDTGAFYKWQSLLGDMRQIIFELNNKNLYQHITHIEFDVFGFSRGAALARHFINAALEGIPDYLNKERSKNPTDIYPNLLGNEAYKRFDHLSDEFYQADKSRRVSVRFVGLFDTVGSFYDAGNDDEGNFILGLKSDAAQTVFQICAKHEYRKNFPLTSLDNNNNDKMNAFSKGAFFQEIFPGCHTDIGGGYPSKMQYGRTDLPKRLNQPIDSTYNIQKIKSESFHEKYKASLEEQSSGYGLSALTGQIIAKENEEWATQSQADNQVHGEVKLVDGELLYYHFIPISNALSGLTFERMKQQGEAHGITWDKDKLFDTPDFDVQDNIAKSLWDKFKEIPLGEISSAHWENEEADLMDTYIHRPHDGIINVGYGGAIDTLVNDIVRDKQGNLTRKVFNNA